MNNTIRINCQMRANKTDAGSVTYGICLGARVSATSAWRSSVQTLLVVAGCNESAGPASLS